MRAFLFVSLLIINLAAHISLLDYAQDDAYIHFRIAGNFIEFGGPYFNAGEKVMVTSSPVWTLLLIFLFAHTGVSPLAVSILNALLTTSCAFLWAAVAQTMKGELSLLEYLSILVISLALLFSSSLGL